VIEFLAQSTWVEWALFALFWLAAFLAWVAWTGERHQEGTLPPRPLPMPPKVPTEYEARHSIEGPTAHMRRMPAGFWVVKDQQEVSWPWRGSPPE
jgi:hypothetical protein